ncbi:hypothetical protein ACFLTD_00145, partial [Elusimicrobiota bacterium]
MSGSDTWETVNNPNARVKALGGAGVALSDCNSPMAINPGMMAYDSYGRLSLFYGNLAEGSHFVYTEYVYPFTRWGSLGGAVEARYDTSTDDYMQFYSAGLGIMLFKGISVGFTGKSILKVLNDEKAQDFAMDAGVHISPFEWMNIGLKAENVIAPELTFESLTEGFARSVRAGISLFHREYFNLVCDIYFLDIEEKYDTMSIKSAYGIEVYPDPAFAIRGGIKDDLWRLGMGIMSKHMNVDYTITSEDDKLIHFFQYSYKFGMSPSRQEEELSKKQENNEKEALYLESLKYLNMGEVAEARKQVVLYIEKYGKDQKITGLEDDIEKWLNKVRKDKMGLAAELKEEILTDYYHGRLEEARVKVENLQLIAPNYED